MKNRPDLIGPGGFFIWPYIKTYTIFYRFFRYTYASASLENLAACSAISSLSSK